jgi:hypothetical protein
LFIVVVVVVVVKSSLEGGVTHSLTVSQTKGPQKSSTSFRHLFHHIPLVTREKEERGSGELYRQNVIYIVPYNHIIFL